MGKDLRGEKNPFYGKHHSDETKRKLALAHIGKSPANKGVPQSMEAREKNRLAHLGKTLSEGSRKKISNALIGRVPWNTGLHLSESHKQKLKLAGIGRHPSEETKCKLHEAQLGNKNNLGKRRSVETKQKMRDAWSEEMRCLARDRFKGIPRTEEVRRKISEGNKGKTVSLESIERMKLTKMNSPVKFPFTNTSIELAIQDSLSDSNIPYTTNPCLIGRPDLFIRPNICIFADGDYWHGPLHPEKQARDKVTNSTLQSQGYVVLRFWEHDIKLDPDNCARCVQEILLRE